MNEKEYIPITSLCKILSGLKGIFLAVKVKE